MQISLVAIKFFSDREREWGKFSKFAEDSNVAFAEE